MSVRPQHSIDRFVPCLNRASQFGVECGEIFVFVLADAGIDSQKGPRSILGRGPQNEIESSEGERRSSDADRWRTGSIPRLRTSTRASALFEESLV